MNEVQRYEVDADGLAQHPLVFLDLRLSAGLASLNASTGNESYTYSAFGTRAKVGTRTFLRAGAGVTAGVLDDGNAKYTPGVSEVRSGTTTYSHSGLKHMGAQTGSGGTVAATNTYDAFGGVQGSTGSWQGPFGTAGAFGYQSPQNGNEQGGLHLLGHRYYDASTGRFLTRDPIGDGSNWYVYCQNSPLMRVDATGLVSIYSMVAGLVSHEDGWSGVPWDNGGFADWCWPGLPVAVATEIVEAPIDPGLGADAGIGLGRGLQGLGGIRLRTQAALDGDFEEAGKPGQDLFYRWNRAGRTSIWEREE